MLKNLKIYSLLVIAFGLGGCAQPEFIALPEELMEDITSSEAYYEKVQDKIYAKVESTNVTALNSGLLFLAIESIADSVKKSNVETSLEPIQKLYNQKRVEEKLQSALYKALKNTKWLHLAKLSAASSIEPKEFEVLLNNSDKDVVILSELDLKLNPRFDVLTGTLFVSVYPAKTMLKDKLGVKNVKDKAIYKTRIMATFELPDFTEDWDYNASKWAENRGQKLWEGLDKVIESLGAQLEAALKNPTTTME